MRFATQLACAAALAFSTFVAGAQDKNPVAAIVGTWKVITYEDRTEGQPVRYPYGEQPRGQLMYDATVTSKATCMTSSSARTRSGRSRLRGTS